MISDRKQFIQATPNKVRMTKLRLLNNEKLPEGFRDTGAVYQGVLFQFAVLTESEALVSGKVKEIILPESNSGVFESMPDTAQALEIDLEDGTAYDANVLTVGKRQEGEMTVKEPSAPQNSVLQTGESVVSQYFVYIKNGRETVIEKSGYKITKTLEGNRLTVKREPLTFFAEHGFVSGGEIGEGGGTFVIDLSL